MFCAIRTEAIIAGLAACLASAVLSRDAGATTLRHMDLREMVQAADHVAHARVAATRVYWDDAHRRILTDTEFDVIEEAKGAGPKRLTVTMPGGRIDPIEMRTEGTPEFSAGEEVVLMTIPAPDGRKNIVGFSQGVLRVHVDPRTGDRFVTAADSAASTPGAGPGISEATGHPSRALRPLSAFMAGIRALVSKGGAQPDGARPSIRLAPVAPGEVAP